MSRPGVQVASYASAPLISRGNLVDRILARPEPIIVIEAPAGMGKSVLLQEIAERIGGVDFPNTWPPISRRGVRLWDIPPHAVPAALPDPSSNSGKLIVCKRTGTRLPGLARAISYGQAYIVGPKDLTFSADELEARFGTDAAPALLDATAGWPLLVGRAGIDIADDLVEQLLLSEVIEPLPAPALLALRDLLGGRPVSSEHLSELAPLVRTGPNKRLALALPHLSRQLDGAVEASLAARAKSAVTASPLGEALAQRGETTRAILTLQGAGLLEEARELYVAASGWFYIYSYGIEEFDAVLSGFPDQYRNQHEELVVGDALRSLKRGDVARARQVLTNHFGAGINDTARVLANRSRYSLALRGFRLVMSIYEDAYLADSWLKRAYELLAEFPVDADLQRGSFYNTLLEFYIRRRRFPEAEDVAIRAGEHYRRANVPILVFFTNLDRAQIRLMQGDVVAARAFADAARSNLDDTPFESANDRRLLALLEACIDYEAGTPETLARFLNEEFDAFSHNEIWPSLIEFALQYGSQALSEYFSAAAARAFLDRWRVYENYNRQFRRMIDLREVAVLQNANRWQEAGERLQGLATDADRTRVLTDEDELTRLTDRDELSLALIALRQAVFDAPQRPGLERQLQAALRNLAMTGRQRLCVEIWLAYVHRRQRDMARALPLLQKVLDTAGRLGAIAPLTEERVFLDELLDNRRIAEFLDASPVARQVIRRLRATGLTHTTLGVKTGLSRRETKVLLMIAEGASTKSIANTLGLSEATIKFHLGNVYRKLGCTKRREAISSARAMGLVS